MRKLTQKQAVEEALRQWQWLADNPDKQKSAYFKEFNLRLVRPLNGCYLCEFIHFLCGVLDCESCPLEGIAWSTTRSTHPEKRYPCECDPTSPYADWDAEFEKATEENGNLVLRSLNTAKTAESARAMVDALKTALEKENP